MNHAKLGADALAAGKFSAAIEAYTDAIAVSPTSPDYLIKRSTAYHKSSPSNCVAALADADNAVRCAQKRAKRELIIQAQLRRAIALFGLERYGDADFVFGIVKRMDPKEKTLAIWTAKVEQKMKDLDHSDPRRRVTVNETPSDSSAENTDNNADGGATGSSDPYNPVVQQPTNTSQAQMQTQAQTPAEKIKHTWYQTSDSVSFTLFAKGVPKDQAEVTITDQSLAISFPLVNSSVYSASFEPLYGSVDVSNSRFDIMSTKIEVTLRKAQPGQKWHALEGTATSANQAPQGSIKAAGAPSIAQQSVTSPAPSYPTSSRHGPKDWDKLATDLTTKKKAKSDKGSESKDTEKPNNEVDDDDDGYDYDREDGDEANAFFKKLYAGATPDARRAMMKSFTESNGTALSTNWEEVSKKKVDVTPPDGMEAKKWEQ